MLNLKNVAATGALLLTAASSQAAVTELVTNGGFETGDFSSWVQFGTGSAMGDGAAGDAPSVFIASESITVTSGDTFDGQSLFLYVSFNNEHLVAKSDSVTFTFDNPVWT